jgi:aerotaxis receptor
MLDKESPFHISELFFSKTDKRGVIKSGNNVFVRVSEFDEVDLLEKPHNIIRHPDMPRTVFKLLWDTIQGGNPIGAYVKNKSKSGAYYTKSV